MTDKPKPAPGWYKSQRREGELRYWDGSAWTDQYQLMSPAKRGLKASVIFFCIGLGAATFFLLANLGVSTTGYSCGTVMSPETYVGHSADEFSSLDPTGSLGSSFGDAAAATNQMKADGQNSACSDAIDSRRSFAIVAGLVVFAVTLGGVRLFRDGITT